MDCTPYTLDRLVNELREARAASPDPGAIIGRIRSIAERAAVRHREWLREDMCEPDAEQGFGFHLLHEEAGHELAVFVASWLPGRGTPPHDHGTWAVVVGLKGCERNTRWRRLDDSARPGYAEIAPAEERLIGAGDIVTMRSGVIHSVRNEGVGLSVSLHVYGRHVNYTNRSQFDPVGRRETPYKVATKGRSSAGSSTPFAGANHDR
jgi:predicted metal-dependent enzyme (double-stranded beta helix superfamily)